MVSTTFPDFRPSFRPAFMPGAEQPVGEVQFVSDVIMKASPAPTQGDRITLVFEYHGSGYTFIVECVNGVSVDAGFVALDLHGIGTPAAAASAFNDLLNSYFAGLFVTQIMNETTVKLTEADCKLIELSTDAAPRIVCR